MVVQDFRIYEDTLETYMGTSKCVEIPEGVKVIKHACFFLRDTVEEIIIPDSVKRIEEGAFLSCTNLKRIYIPKNVCYIEGPLFQYCNELESIIVDPDNGSYDSRDHCNAIIDRMTDTLISGCKTSTIPDTIDCIGQDAFQRIQTLEKVYIPENITHMEGNPFNGCSSLKEIKVSKKNPVYDSQENNMILEKRTNTLVCGCANTTIPETVEYIEKSAFDECTKLESIEIPDTVKSIEDYAFFGCHNLKSITLPDNLTFIGDYAFADCTQLKEVIIPDKVTYIGRDAFFFCKNLEKVVISKDVIMKENPFQECDGLTIHCLKDSNVCLYAKNHGISVTYI